VAQKTAEDVFCRVGTENADDDKNGEHGENPDFRNYGQKPPAAG
jgi:hypothetical protein